MQTKTRSRRKLSDAEHVALVNSLYGKYKGIIGNSDDIIEERRREVEREEERLKQEHSSRSNGNRAMK